MKNILKILLLGILTIGIVGCTGSEPEVNVSKLDFGKPPNLKKESKRIIAYVRSKLKDPYSAKIEMNTYTPVRAYITLWEKLEAGWVATVSVNAKNSYGAYTGTEYWKVFLSENDEHWHSILFASSLSNYKINSFYNFKTELRPGGGKFY